MKTEIKTKRIAELLATKDQLIGCDDGTHNSPTSYRVYESITGERTGWKVHNGKLISRCTVVEANQNSHGRIRMFPIAQAEIRSKQRELNLLQSAK